MAFNAMFCVGRVCFVMFTVWSMAGLQMEDAISAIDRPPCAGEMQLDCASIAFEYAECNIIPDSRIIIRATVTDKKSKAACDFYNGVVQRDYNGTGIYGFNSNILWVHGGCRANFQICFVNRTTPTTTTSSLTQETSSTHDNSSTNSTTDAHSTDTSHADDSNAFPATAIVAPLLSIFVVGAVVMLAVVWRKRRLKKYKEPKKSDFVNDTTTDRSTNHYTSIDVGSVKKADNITLDPEYSYASLKTKGDITGILPTVDEEQKDSSASTVAAELINHDYFILSHENAYSYANADVAKSGPVIAKIKGICTTTTSSGVDIVAGIQAGKSDGKQHNYYVLEQQNLNTAIVPNTKLGQQSLRTERTKAHKDGQPNVDGQGYLILEPVDTYNTIDPEDVVIQTLPDNEYNIVDIKQKKVVQDKNYDILKPANGTQNNDEYSHTSDFQRKANEVDYSHVTLK